MKLGGGEKWEGKEEKYEKEMSIQIHYLHMNFIINFEEREI